MSHRKFFKHSTVFFNKLWFCQSWMVLLRDFPLPFILLWMHLDQRFKCSCLIFSMRILTNHNLILLNLMLFLYRRINILRIKPPKVSRKLSANKILILLKLVSLAPTLNIIQSSQLYKFYGFETFSGSSFIAHAHSLSRLWHERFGHLNYRNLQHLSKLNFVLGPPKLSFTYGVCLGCVLGKQNQNPFS